MNMIVVRVGLAKERKKLCGSGHSRTLSRPLPDVETMGFVTVAVPRPVSFPLPSYIRERPESETALHYSLRAGRDDSESEVGAGSVAFKLARLALQVDDPPTPDEYYRDGDTASLRDSGIMFGLRGDGEDDDEHDDEEDVKSAREGAFHVIVERDLT